MSVDITTGLTSVSSGRAGAHCYFSSSFIPAAPCIVAGLQVPRVPATVTMRCIRQLCSCAHLASLASGVYVCFPCSPATALLTCFNSFSRQICVAAPALRQSDLTVKEALICDTASHTQEGAALAALPGPL